MAVIGIRYDEGANKRKVMASYTAVTLRARNKKVKSGSVTKIYNSGDFVKDWYNAKRYYIRYAQDDDPHFSHSSSVDHFFMDGANFTPAYLHVVDELYVENGEAKKRRIGVLKYHGDEPKQEVVEGFEYFIPKGRRWTWEELKAYVKKGIVPKKKTKKK